MKSRIFVTHITYEKADHSFKHSIEYFYSTVKKSVKTVCIKVNLCDYRMADSGATTDPVLLGTLVKVLQNKFNPRKIFVIENDATSIEANSLFNLLGFREVAQQHSIHLVNAADEEWINRPVSDGKVFSELEVPRIWLEADLTVNFAKLKTNMITQITGCLKNMFGLLKKKHKSVYHGQIDKVIGDINRVMTSDLCIVDGLVGQEAAGPAFGKPKRCELLIAGTNPVSVDSCCARIMGFNPWFIKHIVHCQRRGIGKLQYILETDIQKFSYNNYKFKFSRAEYLMRSIIRRFTHLSAAG